MSIKLRDIKSGNVVWECQSGWNIRALALEDARRVTDTNENGIPRDGWACKMFLGDGRELEYYESVDAGAYSLRLYDAPQYIPFKHCMIKEDFKTLPIE